MKNGPIEVIVLAAAAIVGSAPAGAQDAKVTITGGVDQTGQNYHWRVTNNYSSPIVSVKFPHFRGDLFTAPDGWSQEWKNQVKLGAKIAPGWCRATARTPEDRIRRGRWVDFSMRLARGGAMARPGTVTIRFADDTEAQVDNVEVPTSKSWLEQNAMGFGLAVIFIIALAIHFRRRKKSATAANPSPPTGDN
jgi:hypothetical protein